MNWKKKTYFIQGWFYTSSELWHQYKCINFLYPYLCMITEAIYLELFQDIKTLTYDDNVAVQRIDHYDSLSNHRVF